MANAAPAPDANTTVVLTEKRLAQLRREHALWVVGALVVGVGVGYAVGRLTIRKAAA